MTVESLDEKRVSKPGTSLEKVLTNVDIDINEVILDAETGEINELAVVAEGEERTTWFIWMLIGCCTISGLLFGESYQQFSSRSGLD